MVGTRQFRDSYKGESLKAQQFFSKIESINWHLPNGSKDKNKKYVTTHINIIISQKKKILEVNGSNLKFKNSEFLTV